MVDSAIACLANFAWCDRVLGQEVGYSVDDMEPAAALRTDQQVAAQFERWPIVVERASQDFE
jgi:hypothetical protein